MSKHSNSNPYGEAVRVIGEGSVYVDYGPVSMVVTAFTGGAPQTELAAAAFPLIESTLAEMSAYLPVLRRYPNETKDVLLAGAPKRMHEAVLAADEPTLTPMAAVAGTMSDTVADWLTQQGADRVFVNNGGDIAIRLGAGQSAQVGLMPKLSEDGVGKVLTIHASDGVGGIATSGLGGRSLTRGVADAVCVLSKTCAMADALATHLANCTYVPSASVTRVKAGTIDPSSDISDLDVTVQVGTLTEREKRQAFDNVLAECKRQHERGNLIGMVTCIQSEIMCYPKHILPQ